MFEQYVAVSVVSVLDLRILGELSWLFSAVLFRELDPMADEHAFLRTFVKLFIACVVRCYCGFILELSSGFGLVRVDKERQQPFGLLQRTTDVCRSL